MGQVAIVTGGSRGIGAATAKLLAEHGWDVCVGYHSNVDAANQVVEACRATGQQAIAVQADVASEPDVTALFTKVDDELGSLGSLINNAGIVAPQSRVDEMKLERLTQMMAVNIIGSFLCVREAIKRMSTAHGGQGGVIVNLSSVAARIGAPGEYVDYAASKGAIDSMTLGLSKEVAEEGIRVNAVRPGIIDTELHASGGQPDRVERFSPLIPMCRGGTSNEVAEAIAWLCSDKASYVTGALLDIGGGR